MAPLAGCRVVLPPEVLQVLGITPGDHVRFLMDDRGTIRLHELD